MKILAVGNVVVDRLYFVQVAEHFRDIDMLFGCGGILKEFPGKTGGDLYLWVLDRLRYLHAECQNLVSPRKAAKDFLEEVK